MKIATGTLGPLHRATASARQWLEPLARVGIAAKGVVYLLVGGVALRAALGAGDGPAGHHDALHVLLREPWGKLFLAVTAIGLAAYVIWRLSEAIFDPEGFGRTAKGLARRAGSVLIALVYSGLAASTARLALGGGGGPDEATHGRKASADLLDVPGGELLLLGVGIGIIVFGVYEAQKGLRATFLREMRTAQMSVTELVWVTRLGVLGHLAHGLVFGVIGWFAIQAAQRSDPGKIQGTRGALRALERSEWGPWLLGAAAVGLLAYGLYELAEARYRRVAPA